MPKVKTRPAAARGREAALATKRTPATWVWIAGAGLLALIVRFLYLAQIHDAAFFTLRLGDAASYHAWARRIADGDWLGRDVFYQAPLYPYFLAIVYRLFGDSVMTVCAIQALLGAGSCALLAWTGVRLFGRWGALAGVALAIYGPAIYQDELMDKSALGMLLVCLLIALTAARRWVWCGVVLGLLALTRENALLLAIPLVAWIGWRSRGSLSFAAGLAAVLLPVGVRNFAVGGSFTLTTAQFGPNFYIGNHAGATGTYEPLVTGHGNASDEREDATRLAQHAEGRQLKPAGVSAYWTSQALRFIVGQPARWAILMVRKLGLLLNAAEISDTESQDVYAESSSLLSVASRFDFGMVLGLAMFTAIATWGARRDRAWLYGFAIVYGVSVVAFYMLARYRLPIVPPLLLIAAGATLRRERVVPAALAGLAVVALSHWPIDEARSARATHYYAIATELAKDPSRATDADNFYRRALEVDPRMPAAHFGEGTLLARSGRFADAIPHYEAAIAAWPDYAEAHYNLGAALSQERRFEDAARQYGEAIRLRPEDADAHTALGKTLLALDRPDAAIAEYERARGLAPGSAGVWAGLGVARAQAGVTDEAIAAFQKAVSIDANNATAENCWGTALANSGRVREAIPHFARAVELGDKSARTNLDQARQMMR